jgi:hypothetical protein
MLNESFLRKQAREAIRLGKVPSRQPDRLWGGHGVGAVCTICRSPAAGDQIEIAVEFVLAETLSGLDKYHFHLRCFAAWEFERGQARVSDTFRTFLNGVSIRGGYCLSCLSRMYSESAPTVARLLSEIGISSRQATCANCDERRETFRSDPSS